MSQPFGKVCIPTFFFVRCPRFARSPLLENSGPKRPMTRPPASPSVKRLASLGVCRCHRRSIC